MPRSTRCAAVRVATEPVAEIMADDRYPRGLSTRPVWSRDASGGSRAALDPLTELARLIGQSDPFASDPRGAARTPAASRAWTGATARGREHVRGTTLRRSCRRSRAGPPAGRSPRRRRAAVDDRFRSRGAPDQPRLSCRCSPTIRRRHDRASMSRAADRASRCPRATASRCYPRCRGVSGADDYERAAEPRGYDRSAPAEHAYRPERRSCRRSRLSGQGAGLSGEGSRSSGPCRCAGRGAPISTDDHRYAAVRPSRP